jgi:ribonuclease-3
MSPDLEALESALGHRFQQRRLLERALTHKSLIAEKSGLLADNEQLEFLGDAVLGFLVSEYLVSRYPDYPEGKLSKLKAHLVSANHLHTIGQRLSVGGYLLLGRGEEMSGGRAKKALLANAVEALLAALYLDGGIEVARRFVIQQVVDSASESEFGLESLVDYKSALQEAAQARKLPPPRYVIIAEHGPEHAKTFVVEARLGKQWTSQAQGQSKKAAGQKAAAQILEQLRECDTARPEGSGGPVS